MAALDLGLDVALTGPTLAALYLLLVAPPAWSGARRLAPILDEGLPGPRSLLTPSLDPGMGWKVAGVGAVLALAAVWAGHSNVVRSYPYLHHPDGWIHLGNARAVMEHGGLPYDSWLSGASTQGPTHETGFWYLLSALAWMTPLSVTQVAFHAKLVFLPALALAAWAYGAGGERPFGLEAALLVPLVPTTHRFLGPMFLVPVTVVLTLALGAGILARSTRRRWALPAMLLLAVGGLLIHAPTAGVLALVAGWRLVLGEGGRREPWGRLLHAAVFAAGLLLVLTQVPHLDRWWREVLGAWPELRGVAEWGLSGAADHIRRHLTRWSALLFGLGVVAAVRRRRPDAQALCLALVPILALVVIYEPASRVFASVYGGAFFHVGFLYLLIAAVGLAEARHEATRGLERLGAWLRPKVVERAGRRLRERGPGSVPGRTLLVRALVPSTALLAATIAGFAVTAAGAGALQVQVDEIKRGTYYDTEPENETFERFLWVHDHRHELRGAELAVVDPDDAGEFAAVTGLHAWSHSSHPLVRPGEAEAVRSFLEDGCQPRDYMNETGAGLVVGADCSGAGPGYERVHDQVYLYEPGLPDGP